MRKNMRKVIEAFLKREAAIGDSKKTCSTNGNVIWSYVMPIARHGDDGVVYLLEYNEAPSVTTRRQVQECLIAMSPTREIIRRCRIDTGPKDEPPTLSENGRLAPLLQPGEVRKRRQRNMRVYGCDSEQKTPSTYHNPNRVPRFTEEV